MHLHSFGEETPTSSQSGFDHPSALPAPSGTSSKSDDTMRKLPWPALLFACSALTSPILCPAQSTASATKPDEPVMLSVFSVSEDADEGYRSTQTTSGS